MKSISPPGASSPEVPRRKFNGGLVAALLSLVVIFGVARYAVTHFRRAGSMSVIEAQAMDMSVMKPPIGAVPVEVMAVTRGTMRSAVSYTGSALAFNEAQIAPRVTGRIIEMAVYPGDRVKAGQLLARLDSDELRAKESSARYAREAASQDRLIAGDEAESARAIQSQARAEASRSRGQKQENEAGIGGARAAVHVAENEVEVARQGVAAAQSEVEVARSDKRMAQANASEAEAGLSDASGEVESARAEVEQARERLPQAQSEVEAARADVQFAQNKRDRSAELLKQGAISREEFQSDDAALKNASARLDSALAKVREAQAEIAQSEAGERKAIAGMRGANAKITGARAAVSRADAQINAAQQKLAQSRVSVASAQGKAEQSRAEVGVARARLEQSQAGIGAAQALEHSARANLRKAGNQASRASSMEGQADSQLSEAQIVRGYTEIRAPSEGVITKRLVAPGSLVDPGTTILQISQVNPIRFQASVAQSDLNAIRVGTSVTIRAASGQKSVQTRVSAVFPAADPQSRTGIVEAVFPNDDGRFKPGEYIVMNLAASQTMGSLKVPTEALVMQSAGDGGSQVVAMRETASVWVMERARSGAPSIYTCTMHPQIRQDKPGSCPICHMKLTPLEAGGAYRARLVPVKTGVSDGDFTEVIGGIEAGAQVLTRGYDDLKDGDSVVPARFGTDGPLELPDANSDGANMEAMPDMRMSGEPTPSQSNQLRVSVNETGFSPASFNLKKGVPSTLIFTRTTDATCATEIVWPDFKLNKKLPLNVPVTIEIVPKKSGLTTFACGMNMFKGQVIVR